LRETVAQNELVSILELVKYKYSSSAQNKFFLEEKLRKLFILLKDQIRAAPYTLKPDSPYHARVDKKLPAE
jgi:hypothetical protein